jgi:hypothetical protein
VLPNPNSTPVPTFPLCSISAIHVLVHNQTILVKKYRRNVRASITYGVIHDSPQDQIGIDWYRQRHKLENKRASVHFSLTFLDN